MTRRSRWLWVPPACLVVVALSCGTAGAAEKTKVDRATKQVEHGAKEIGRGSVGPGFKEMFSVPHHLPAAPAGNPVDLASAFLSRVLR